MKDTVNWGRCFNALFKIQFCSGALLNYRSQMASWNASELVSLDSLARAYRHSHISINSRNEGIVISWHWDTRPSARDAGFSEYERVIPPWVARGGDGVGTLKNLFGHSPQSSVFRIKEFNIALHLSLLHIHLVGLWPLQTVDLSSQSGVPGDLQMLKQSFLQEYHTLNTNW